jgi:hypothetical protein
MKSGCLPTFIVEMWCIAPYAHPLVKILYLGVIHPISQGNRQFTRPKHQNLPGNESIANEAKDKLLPYSGGLHICAVLTA